MVRFRAEMTRVLMEHLRKLVAPGCTCRWVGSELMICDHCLKDLEGLSHDRVSR